MDIQDLLNKLRNDSIGLGINLNRPAKASDIEKLESLLNQPLPSDFKKFYELANGFYTTDWLFQLLPIEKIITERNKNRLCFAEYMIYSDTWELIVIPDKSEDYKIVNANHGGGETIVLTNSLFEFIERYIDGEGLFGENGLYAWYDELKLKT